eukprot:CAMPEP_0197899192 /NCGR_PEP_ID=MMETSP1439-20131203/45898_1 /TAXON_ID=66791 /ORGANISM="Gonyaulax spinifera, Strain CCMP409" /LENGTH=61 /DNA_ID=CAMNT_0043519969 /DNA_START=9 /DNA_END=191 /DNA_ORIENTATION=-
MSVQLNRRRCPCCRPPVAALTGAAQRRLATVRWQSHCGAGNWALAEPEQRSGGRGRGFYRP